MSARLLALDEAMIGSYGSPDARLRGAGGAREIAASCREVLLGP